MSSRRSEHVKTPTRLQYDSAECGAAALGILLSFYGCHVPLEELREACGVSRDGSNALNIIKAARRYGMEASGVRRSSLEGLKTLTAPVILYWNFNHFVVFEGVDKTKIYINDPASGPRTIPFSEFDKAFTGLVLICTPGADFQQRGKPFTVIDSLRELVRGSERALFLIGFVSVLLLIPGLLLPGLLRYFIDSVLGGSHALLDMLLAGMAAVFLSRVILTWAQQSLFLRLEYKLTFDSSSAFFRHLIRLPIAFFAQRLSGDLVARVQLNQRVAQLLSGEVATAAISGLLIGFYGLLMIQYDVLLTVITVFFALLNLIALRYAARFRRDANARLLQEQAKLNGIATNGLQAIESLKASGMEATFFARWAGLHAKAVNAEQDLNRIAFLTNAVPFLLIMLNMVLILIIGGERVLAGQFTAGMVIAFQSLALGFMQPLGQLTEFGTQLQEVEGSLDRLHDVLEYPIEVEASPATSSTSSDGIQGDPVMRLAGALTVQDVSFGYSPLDPPILNAISFEIQPGQQIALVGASGSGKSTIARLIANLYPAWRGSILFDGKLRTAIPRAVLHSSLAIVDQTIMLFSGTVRDNITLWDAAVSLEMVIAAAKDACIHDVIMARPGGYDSRVEENGVNFSGGERQRLEIARALIHNPTLLILDEATSALDTMTEGHVIRNIQRRGCACLMLAHRLSAIQYCSAILVLEQGALIWRGTYDQYLEREGLSDLSASDSSHVPAVIPLPFVDEEATRPGRLTVIQRKTARWEQGESLYYALRHIFAALHVEVSDETLRSRIALVPQSNNTIYSIASAFHLRTRRVKLPPDWWQTSDGPLLGYWSGNQLPVALIQNRTKRYQTVDATDSAHVKRRPLNKTRALQLTGTAYVFYKPLPDRALTFRDLCTFAIPALGSEGLILGSLVVLIGLSSLLLPIATGLIFDQVIPSGSSKGLLILGGLLIAGALLATVLNLIAALVLTRLEGKTDSILQSALWDRLLRLPVSFFRTYAIGDLVERAMGISQIRSVLADVSAYILVGGVLVAINLLLLYSYNVVLASAVLVIFLIYLIVAVQLGRLQIRYQRQALDMNGEQRNFALQIIASIRKLRAAEAEWRAFDLWLARFTRERKADYAAKTRQAIATTFLAGYPIAAAALLFWLVVNDSTLNLGQFLAFNVAFVQLLAAGSQLGRAAAKIQSVLPVFDRLLPVIQAVPEMSGIDLPVRALSGHIRIAGVSFRYSPQSHYVIDNLSIEIKPGEFIAITSPSGNGKSTLLRLLLGFESQEQGEIYFDNYPLSMLDVESLRSQIGVVLQNGLMVAGDIFTNIVGSRDLTIADAWRAAQLAAVEQDIKQMPMGMNTMINEGQSSLSGGQIQRLLIARALVAKPKIVFLDEATSAIDERNQMIILENLKALQVTCIVIAHRLSTVANADRHFTLENGRLTSV